MIDYILVFIVFIYLLLVIALIIKEQTIGSLAGIGIIIVGIYLAINGAGDVKNFLTTSFAIVNIGIGIYVFLEGSLTAITEAI